MKHGSRTVETFVVYPESKDKRPVVVIIHEIFGMTDWVQDGGYSIGAAGHAIVNVAFLGQANIEDAMTSGM